MRKMTSKEIRNMWIKFFESKGHQLVKSAPLVPIDDDSLLWINAGVTPLKKYFDGSVIPENRRIVNIQKCIRTNDIENVGVTARHQTFFEMMGNFSIGDYFKNEAIEFAFELLTSKDWFDVPKELLWVTVYTDDVEAYNKWVEVGFIEDHIVKLDGNFWEIGEGPCGPDSELFFDRGEKYDPEGDALEKFKADEDQARYVEIWNNVFSQFNSKEGVPREEYKELPHKNIDTGAGLERWACVFQEVDTNFDTDLFTPIIHKIEDLSGVLYNGEMAYKVIADHIRAITLALADGATFENVGRGYVLRRLLRRSVRFGAKLGLNEPFMYKLVEVIASEMGDIYPEVLDQKDYVTNLVLQEEELFHKTLAAGEKRLVDLMKNSKDNFIPGKEVFKLYDTYGFPFELTLEVLEEEGYTTSQEEFNKCMEEQKNLAKSSRKQEFTMNAQNEELMNYFEEVEFLYNTYKNSSKVLSLFDGNTFVDKLSKEGYVITKETCFYAEQGGQISDTGMLIGRNFKARVLDVVKMPNGQHMHKVRILDGIIKEDDEVELVIDVERRKKIECNHSAVHITQYQLQQTISDKIHQAGSKVTDEILRFDFTYTGKITDNEIIELEENINDYIKGQYQTRTDVMPLEEAKKTGAIALFNEKYKGDVRVVTIGDSKELCGGTHITNTREIKKYAIVNVESKGSNVYRLEAATNDAIEHVLADVVYQVNDEIVKLMMKAKNIVSMAKASGIKLSNNIKFDNSAPKSYKDVVLRKKKLEELKEEVKNLEKKYKELSQKAALADLSDYEKEIKEVNGTKVLLVKTRNLEVANLKDIADSMLNKMGTGFILFANVKEDDAVNFIARSNIELSAGDVVKLASTKSNGNGGGSKTFAQGAGKTKEYIEEIFEEVQNLL